MASRQSQANYSTPYPTNPSQQQLDLGDDDVKAPYDDLIDQYATPYQRQSDYKAYSLNPNDASHTRQPSYPLSHKQSYAGQTTGKDSIDGRTDWEYPPATVKQDKIKEKANFWATLLPDSIACRLYVLTVLVETIIDLAIEADLFARFQQVGNTNDDNDVASRKMPVYLSIFAIAHVFQFGMALEAVCTRNTLQFIGLTIFNALFLVYAIIQRTEIKGLVPAGTTGFSDIPINVLTTIPPIVIAVSELAYIALGWKIYQDFGWKVYKFLGADRQIKAMYAWYQIFLCLIKFDVFFWVGFSIQFIWLVLNKHNAEYYLTCAALPLSLVLLIEGHLAARHENKLMMLTFMTGCVAAMVYFVYKLQKVLRFKDTPTFALVWQTLTTFSVLAILLLLATMIVATIVLNNFGRGLKKQMAKNTPDQQRGKTQNEYRGPMSGHPYRMSID